MLHTFTLPNGFTILYKERPGSTNVAISLRILAGSIYQAMDERGVAHFLEHIVLDGTQKYPSEQKLSLLIEEKGGYKNGLTNKETAEYIVKLLKEDVESGFEYLSEIIQHPLLLERDVEREKQIITQEIHRTKSDPKLFAPRLIYNVLYPGTPLDGLVTGEPEDVQRVTQQKVAEYMKKHYCAHNAVLAIVGDLDPAVIKKLAQKYFGKMVAGKKTLQVKNLGGNAQKFRIENVSHVKQAMLTIAFSTPGASDDERYVFDIISRVLTRGRTSRLMSKIRGEMGLAYGVNSYNVAYRNHGMFAMYVGVSEENAAQCLSIIKDEIQKICAEPLPTEELQKALLSLKANLAFSFEDSLNEASFYSHGWCASSAKTIENEIRAYERIIKDSPYIQTVARKVFATHPSILLLASKGQTLVW